MIGVDKQINDILKNNLIRPDDASVLLVKKKGSSFYHLEIPSTNDRFDMVAGVLGTTS